MSLRDEYSKVVKDVEQLATRKRQWVPGVEWLGTEGTLTTDAISGEPEWDALLNLWGLDSNEFEIIEPVLFNSWGGEDGLTNRQFKARVKKRVHAGVDIDELVSRAMKHKPSKKTYDGDSVLNVVLGDWQIGKSDGDGVEGTIARILDRKEAVIDRVRELRKIGRKINTLNVLWVGDSIEGCMGFYSSQTFSVELNRRDQVKITRRLLAESLQSWSKHFDQIIVAAVGGNHGENRNTGKAYTGAADNDDIAIVEQVAEVLSANPEAFGHVKFVIAHDNLTLTIPSAGWVLGISHGHLSRSGTGVEGKLRNWFGAQAAGKQPIGDSDVLVTGHYHHLRVADWGGCVWLQAPALDGGSEYWRVMAGESSETGMLTFVMSEEKRVHDIAVL